MLLEVCCCWLFKVRCLSLLLLIAVGYRWLLFVGAANVVGCSFFVVAVAVMCRVLFVVRGCLLFVVVLRLLLVFVCHYRCCCWLFAVR